MSRSELAIIGAGPAGLAAAYTAAREGECTLVLEADQRVGGLSKTVEYKGFRCDIGGHRFFTKSQEVERLWHELLPDDLLKRPRLSRIYYRGKYYRYPLQAFDALARLGLIESAEVIASYLRARAFPRHPELTFEDWVANRFGHRLFSMFFRTYTEKVWGIPCSRLSADWAAQRIRNLDLGKAVLDALGLRRGEKVTSLIHTFEYPRLGPGQMYEAMADRVSRQGSVALKHDVTELCHEGQRVVALKAKTPSGPVAIDVDRVISTMPLSELVRRMRPEPPAQVLAAAERLTYRSIITVNLIAERARIVPDNWVYLHAPEVKAGRAQLYKNWSQAMVPGERFSLVGLEYFATEGDSLWSMPEQSLIRLGQGDLATLGWVAQEEITDGFVVRYPKAYPVYDDGYAQSVQVIREYLSQFVNLECAGRYGQFRYNNMDHSILTGLLAVRKLHGEACDPWSVNEDGQYHESR